MKDASGGVIPGATVVLISETRGTKSAPAVTNENGDYVFPNVTADTYTIEITMQGFKMLKRAGVAVSGGATTTAGRRTATTGATTDGRTTTTGRVTTTRGTAWPAVAA